MRTLEAPTGSEPPAAPGRSSWRRYLVVATVLAIATFWIWLFAIGPQEDTESLLDDERFTVAAETRCAVAQERIALLPPARTADSPEERAGVLVQANAEVDALVADLRADLPASERDRVLVGHWLDDYEGYAASRRTHAELLARGEDPQFAVQGVGGRPITRRMDAFAELNAMPSCAVPEDV